MTAEQKEFALKLLEEAIHIVPTGDRDGLTEKLVELINGLDLTVDMMTIRARNFVLSDLDDDDQDQ